MGCIPAWMLISEVQTADLSACSKTPFPMSDVKRLAAKRSSTIVASVAPRHGRDRLQYIDKLMCTSSPRECDTSRQVSGCIVSGNVDPGNVSFLIRSGAERTIIRLKDDSVGAMSGILALIAD